MLQQAEPILPAEVGWRWPVQSSRQLGKSCCCREAATYINCARLGSYISGQRCHLAIMLRRP